MYRALIGSGLEVSFMAAVLYFRSDCRSPVRACVNMSFRPIRTR